MRAAALIGGASRPRVFSRASFVMFMLAALAGPAAADTSSSEGPSSQPIDLAPGGNYAAGTLLHIPGQGFTFSIPTGWHATVFEDSELPFLVSDNGPGLGMIFPLAQATADGVESELEQPLLLSHGVSFVPSGILVKRESTFTRSYVSDSSIGRALALLGSQRCVVYFLMGPEHEAASYERTLEELAGSTRFVGESHDNGEKGIKERLR